MFCPTRTGSAIFSYGCAAWRLCDRWIHKLIVRIVVFNSNVFILSLLNLRDLLLKGHSFFWKLPVEFNDAATWLIFLFNFLTSRQVCQNIKWWVKRHGIMQRQSSLTYICWSSNKERSGCHALRFARDLSNLKLLDCLIFQLNLLQESKIFKFKLLVDL